ncbi:twin-arginine translocase subunit TatC [Candidatus Ishikawella capsulata]|uniref:Sec-independent protein translocase protein TatC n=1 Tax=Candidatus Ishikawaella capsulata Mpkobe TaxID=476281 RepID=C5WDP9_9ENTR|nr:twin-arginine translocase subunit TatC [Candidatus Ishikawaella capsulata]BAH83455.1 TatABCE protein translocation system subunit [Candidatus Ishikawaella capsulata Mpkobe]
MCIEDTEPLISHLIELRKRLLNCIYTIFIIFLSLVYFSNNIYQLVAAPLIKQMPVGANMIATEVASPFITPIKLTITVSVFLAMPVIFYQIWKFIEPGLYIHERKLVVPMLFFSVLLFYIGIIFAYFIIFPLMFNFFSHTIPHDVRIATDITHYLNFVIVVFMAFGIAFEIPIIIILICCSGIITRQTLIKNRPYIFLGSFIISMLLTPPDIFSQILLAVPIYFLFEIGLFFSYYYSKTSIKK